MTGQPGFAAGKMRPNGSKGRGFAVGAPARRSRDGNGKTSAPVGPMTGQPGFAGQNATEREQEPGRERKPRVGKEESPPLSRGRLRNLPMALLS